MLGNQNRKVLLICFLFCLAVAMPVAASAACRFEVQHKNVATGKTKKYMLSGKKPLEIDTQIATCSAILKETKRPQENVVYRGFQFDCTYKSNGQGLTAGPIVSDSGKPVFDLQHISLSNAKKVQTDMFRLLAECNMKRK